MGLSELRGVTHDFGFGAVYKGFVDVGMRPGLAVKLFNTTGFQGHRQWLAEVQPELHVPKAASGTPGWPVVRNLFQVA